MSMRFNVVSRELLTAIATSPEELFWTSILPSTLHDMQALGDVQVYREDQPSCPPTNTSRFWSSLLDILPMGIMILSQEIDLVYANPKAQTLCQCCTDSQESNGLPAVIHTIGQQLVQKPRFETAPLLAELMLKSAEPSQTFKLRIRAFWSQSASDKDNNQSPHRQFMVLVLENTQEALHEERLIEQRKYELTERESEIWHLLRQDYSYQDIATRLQISLNTVKTHIKNVYAKRRSYDGQDKLLII